MKVVLTMVVQDEVDIVDSHVAFHLNAGVDHVLVTDNASTDGTAEALEPYVREGRLTLFREEGDFRQPEWVTRMARYAATELGADWVVNSDADEFWWPRGGTLKEVLDRVPARFGCVRGMWRHFAPRPEGPQFFAERMTVRVCDPGTRSVTAFSPRFKTAHRADPDVVVDSGNHLALSPRLVPIHGWYPIDILHFPIRSLPQCERKYLRWWELAQRRGEQPSSFWEAAHEAHLRGRMSEFYESHVVDDVALARGSAEGTLALDVRLREAFERIRAGGEPDFATPGSDASYVSELAALDGSAPLERALRKLDALESRVDELETTLGPRVQRRARPLAGHLRRRPRTAEARPAP